jgi:hypothetical protein
LDLRHHAQTHRQSAHGKAVPAVSPQRKPNRVCIGRYLAYASAQKSMTVAPIVDWKGKQRMRLGDNYRPASAQTAAQVVSMSETTQAALVSRNRRVKLSSSMGNRNHPADINKNLASVGMLVA